METCRSIEYIVDTSIVWSWQDIGWHSDLRKLSVRTFSLLSISQPVIHPPLEMNTFLIFHLKIFTKIFLSFFHLWLLYILLFFHNPFSPYDLSAAPAACHRHPSGFVRFHWFNSCALRSTSLGVEGFHFSVNTSLSTLYHFSCIVPEPLSTCQRRPRLVTGFPWLHLLPRALPSSLRNTSLGGKVVLIFL